MQELDYSIIAALAAGVLVLSLLCGWIGLPVLRRLQVGQTVRQDGPASHYAKTGTPTFGGLFFGVPLVVSGLVATLLNPAMIHFTLLSVFVFLSGLIGFADDYVKVRIKPKGLSMRTKTFAMLAVEAVFVLVYLYLLPDEPVLILPFSQRVLLITPVWKPAYGAFLLVYLYFFGNAVNLTDGVDGLCTSVTTLVGISIVVCAITAMKLIPAGATTALLFAAATTAACIGFLPYNRHKAKVFMGDTGSLALGASVSAAAVLLGMPWLLIPAGVIYLAEALSVVIQVIYFRKTGGKRIFRMSPIHHHYELGGWSEWKIVGVFSSVTIVGGIIAVLMVI